MVQRLDVETARISTACIVPRRLRCRAPKLLAFLLLATWGCDSASFTPPRPAELTTRPAASSSAPGGTAGSIASVGGTRPIVLILGPHDPVDLDWVKTGVRMQAGLDRVLAEVVGGKTDVTAASQISSIREAFARKPLALVVEPVDPKDPELAKVLDEARSRGVTVVLVGRALPVDAKPASGGSAPMHVLVPEPFEDSAKILVGDAMRNARTAKLPADGGAVILVNTACDPLVGERARALRGALEAKGVKPIDEIQYAGDLAVGKQKLIDALKARPGLGIVLAADFESLTLAYQGLGKDTGFHAYVVAGYTHDESQKPSANLGDYAAIAVFSSDRMIRKGVNIAASAAQGSAQKERIELRVPIYESTEGAGLPVTKGELKPAKPSK